LEALLSETHLKPQERFCIRKYQLYRIDCHPERKGETAIAVRKGIPHRQVDLSPLVSIEVTAYQLVTAKYYLQLFINLQIIPGVIQISLTC
jgi:hypothetical protein